MLDRGETEARKRHKKLKWWDDERAIDGVIMVTLAEGWAFYDNVLEGDGDACHVQGFETVKEAMEYVRKAKPCRCQRCRGIEQ